jgi:hypothetical protein
MKRKSMIGLIVLTMIALTPCSALQKYKSGASGDATSPNALSKSEKKEGWKLLFDGKSFDGWHGFNMKGIPDCWKIEDGIMKMTTVGGAESQDVITDKTYKSFELKLEFRLTKGANSGIIYHVAEDLKYKFPYETGAEYQVIDQDNWPGQLEDWQICGASYAMYPPKVRPYKPVGEWNQVHLIVNGNKVTHILNGKVVVEFEKYSDDWKKLRASGKWSDFPDYGKFDEGHISLQNHGTHVDYRSVRIKEL